MYNDQYSKKLFNLYMHGVSMGEAVGVLGGPICETFCSGGSFCMGPESGARKIAILSLDISSKLAFYEIVIYSNKIPNFVQKE